MSSKLHPDSSNLLEHVIKPAFEISLKKRRLRVSRNNQYKGNREPFLLNLENYGKLAYHLTRSRDLKNTRSQFSTGKDYLYDLYGDVPHDLTGNGLSHLCPS